MSAKKLFYIGERSNPQLSKSYFRAYGQLTKKEAAEKANCSYGGMYLRSYNSKDEYETALEQLKINGFKVV